MPVVIFAIVLIAVLVVMHGVYRENRKEQRALHVPRSKLAKKQQQQEEQEILAEAANIARAIKITNVEEDAKDKVVNKFVDDHFNPQEPEKNDIHDKEQTTKP